MKNRKLWLDDIRLPPEEYDVWCTNAEDAIKFLKQHWGKVDCISLDHDLGDENSLTGYDVLCYIEEEVLAYHIEPVFEISGIEHVVG